MTMRVLSLTTALVVLFSSTTLEARLNGRKEISNKNSKPQHRRLEMTPEEEIDFLLNPVEVTVPGDNEEPVSAFPLSTCEGDCDADDDCEDGLICFQRRPDDPVPGCLFSPDRSSNATITESTDVCVPIPVSRGNMEFAGNDGVPTESFPLQICQADCDGDRDCDDGLVCLDRDEEDDPVSIYCNGAPFNDEDYCVPAPGVVPPIPGVTIPDLPGSIADVAEPEEEAIAINATATEGNITTTTDLDTTPPIDTAEAINSINSLGGDDGDEEDDVTTAISKLGFN